MNRGILALVAAVAMAFTHDSVWNFLVFGLIMGISSGLFFAAGPNLVIEAVPERFTGVSTGMQSLVVAFAGSVMPVVFGAILAANAGPPSAEGGHGTYTSTGFDWIYGVLSLCALAAVVLTATMRHGRQPATGGADLGH